MTYLKLRRKYMLLQADQMHKMTSISLKMVEVVILSENSCHLSVAQLVTTVIFFSAWEKSRVKWDSSQNSTQKMSTILCQCDLFFHQFPQNIITDVLGMGFKSLSREIMFLTFYFSLSNSPWKIKPIFSSDYLHRSKIKCVESV